MTESGDTDPTQPKEMQQNPPQPTKEGGDRDQEAGEQDFVEDMESDPARAGSDSPGEDLLGG
jgi:hypothetical protein